mgnify:CR=1 FL=1
MTTNKWHNVYRVEEQLEFSDDIKRLKKML